MPINLGDNCIYTALAKSKLEEFEKNGRGESDRIGARWGEAKRLLEKPDENARLPILFSDAAKDMENLIYWTILTDIDVNEDGTKYKFERFSRLEKGHKTQNLILCSTNKEIAPNFIRAYAICKIPDWLDKLAEA